MKYSNVIKHIESKLLKVLPTGKVKDMPLSKIYGFSRLAEDGKISIVPDEAVIIKKVFEIICADSKELLSTKLDNLAYELKTKKITNRSDRNWSRITLLKLIKPIYSGSVISSTGKWVPSKFYPAIVPVDLCKKAIKRLKSENLL